MTPILSDPCFLWHPQFIGADSAQIFEQKLREETYGRSVIQKSFGKSGPYWNKHKRMARFGDPVVTYTYRGKQKPVLPWTPTLLEIKQLVEDYSQKTFNCVVVNFYENGEADLYPHSDTKYIPQLGEEPVIPAISFGCTRIFELIKNDGTETQRFHLCAGDLFIMRGRSQADWKHGIPKSDDTSARVSLTFREHIV